MLKRLFGGERRLRKLVFIGESNILQLRLAYETRRAAIGSPPADEVSFAYIGHATDFFEDFFTPRPGGILLRAERLQVPVDGLVDADGVFPVDRDAFYVASVATHTQSVLTGAAWRDSAPWWTSPEPPRPPMSRAVFRKCVMLRNRHAFRFIRALRDLSGGRVCVLDAPPPTRRFNLFDYGYGADDVKRIDAEMRALTARRIAKLGVPLIPNPPDCARDGFLKDEFLMPDPADRHHGNYDFGAIALRSLFGAIRRGEVGGR